MNFAVTPSLSSRKSADLLVVPFWQENKGPQVAATAVSLNDQLAGPLSTQDFRAKEGELALIYVTGQPEKRMALLGLGQSEELTVEKLRRAYANVTKMCSKKTFKEINILVPERTLIAKEDLMRGISEGLFLPNYLFNSLKHETIKEDSPGVLEKITWIGASKAELTLVKKYEIICDAVNMVRDLVNGNADDVTPDYLAAVARGLEKTCNHVKTTVFDKKRIEKEKMGLLLAVNRGSSLDPAFIIVEYKGNPKSTDKTILIGKGITFDTGGLNLKPTGGMETMKSDMAGAGAVLGIIQAAASLELKINVTGVIPATENGIDAKSYKPADVYRACTGKTVEISNTDAEGRLVLADAIGYAINHLKPSRLIDLATLTGAVEIALGDEVTGFLSNNDVLADQLIRAGSETGERVWRLPLHEDYRETLKSDIADIKSTGGRAASCIKAALFLQEFVGKTPWVHLDIAGTAYLSEAKRYQTKHATGVGVRLIVSFLETL